MRYKLVFYIEDAETKEIIGEKKQMFVDLAEDQLKRADDVDAEKLKKVNDLIGDCFANRVAHGRGKYIREICTAAGTLVGKSIERLLAKRCGSNHIEMLDAAAEKNRRSKETPGVG
jgi:hypothetical protein